MWYAGGEVSAVAAKTALSESSGSKSSAGEKLRSWGRFLAGDGRGEAAMARRESEISGGAFAAQKR